MPTNIERRWKMEVTKRWNRFLVFFFFEKRLFLRQFLPELKNLPSYIAIPSTTLPRTSPSLESRITALVHSTRAQTWNLSNVLHVLHFCPSHFCKIARLQENFSPNTHATDLAYWIVTTWHHFACELFRHFGCICNYCDTFLSGLLFRCILPEIKVDLTRSGKLDSSNE